jgi:hypothetical protein
MCPRSRAGETIPRDLKSLKRVRSIPVRHRQEPAMIDLLVSVTAFAMVLGPALVATFYSAKAPHRDA